jgi:hypothetical protein
LLTKRLRQLEQAGIVEHLDGTYVLTESGEELRPIVFGMGAWGARWQFADPRDEELDPELLIWWAHDRIDFACLPDRRIVLGFRSRPERRQFWIVKDAAGPSVCTHDPGFEVDVHVDAELAALYEVWLGRVDLRTEVRAGRIELIGPPALVRRLSDAFPLSPAAPLVLAARQEQPRRAQVSAASSWARAHT